MAEFWDQVAQLAASGEPALLATVMAVSGQVPAPPGAHLVVTAADVAGALDGGAADSVAVPLLRAALGRGAFAAQVRVPAEVAHAHGLLHGGAIDLLVHPLSDFAPGMLEAVAAAVSARAGVALVTPLRREGDADTPGQPVLVRDGAVTGDLAGAVLEAVPGIVAAGQPVRWQAEEAAAFVDVVRPAEELIIFGATLMAEALSDLAARAGFRVTLIDDDPAVRERYPSAAEVVITDNPVGTLLARRLTPSTYLVSMTRGHRYDLLAVQHLLRRPLRYLGMMGSRGRVRNALVTLGGDGFTSEEIARLYAPIGLNLGAETPFEIAVSILAQLIQVRRGQHGPASDWGVPAPAGATA